MNLNIFRVQSILEQAELIRMFMRTHETSTHHEVHFTADMDKMILDIKALRNALENEKNSEIAV